MGSEQLQQATGWLRDHQLRALIGEFAVGRNDLCMQALEDMLSFMDQNSDVWLGWTWWAGGPCKKILICFLYNIYQRGQLFPASYFLFFLWEESLMKTWLWFVDFVHENKKKVWGDYIFALDPTDDGQDRPQMAVLEPHFSTSSLISAQADGTNPLDFFGWLMVALALLGSGIGIGILYRRKTKFENQTKVDPSGVYREMSPHSARSVT